MADGSGSGDGLSKKIYGQGGGGGNSKDTLFSKETVSLVDLYSEGPIRSLFKNGYKSLYINNTPWQNSDDTYTIPQEKMIVQYNLGLPDQAYLKGFPDVEAEDVISAQVKNGIPQVRTVSDLDTDEIRITIRLPALFSTGKKGSLHPAEAQITIEYQPLGGDYIGVINDLISGKTESQYDRSYRFKLTGVGPWNVKVSRNYPDSTDPAKLQNDTFWQSSTRIKDIKLSYADSVTCGILADAEHFSSIPSRKAFGQWLIVQVPSNYDVDTRIYDGIWNGVFKNEWTNNPVWVLYAILTNKRWGLGKYIPNIQVDKWALYNIAQYCDVLVPNGFGGFEPRYTFNGGFSTGDDAIRGIQTVAGIFRGMVYVAGGTVVVTCDMPGTVVKEFNQTNVIDGKFTYSGTALKTRHNAIYVTWYNPQLQGDKDTEAFQRTDLIRKNGYIPEDVVAVGCTSRGQAQRTARWIIETDNSNTETCTFQVGYMHADARPGQIVAIADPAYQGIRAGGRVKGLIVDPITIKGTGLVLDDPLTIVGAGHSIHLTGHDGTIINLPINESDTTTDTVTFVNPIDFPGSGDYKPEVHWEDISTADVPPELPPRYMYVYEMVLGVPTILTDSSLDGKTRYIVVPMQDVPYGGSVWLYYGHVVPREFRVVSCKENSAESTFDVTALLHDPNKYARVEYGIQFDNPVFTQIRTPVASPSNVTIREEQYIYMGKATSRATVSWTHSPTPNKKDYIVYASSPTEGLRQVGRTTTTSLDVDDIDAGDWQFSVVATNSHGQESVPAVKGHAALGWEGAMSLTVSSLQVVNDSGSNQWNSPDITIKWVNDFGGNVAPDAMANPFYKNTRVRVYDQATSTLKRTVYVRAESYTYKLSYNNLDFLGVPERSLKFEVVLFDTLGRQSIPVFLLASNVAPAALVPVIGLLNQSINVKLPLVPDLDFKGYLVWRDITPGFIPGPSNLVYDGPSNNVLIPGISSSTSYIRAAAYDTFSKLDLNLSSEISQVPGSNYLTAYITTPTGFTVNHTTWTQIVSVTLTTTGNPTLLIMNNNLAIADDVVWQIERFDGTTTVQVAAAKLAATASFFYTSFSLSEQLAAGTYTYKLSIEKDNTGTASITINQCGLIVTEINK